MNPSTRRGLWVAGAVVVVVVAVVLVLVLGSSQTKHHQAAGAKGLSGPRILNRGTSHCYVPPGQGRMGVCAPPPNPGAALLPTLGSGYIGADVSNYQGCVDPRGLAFIVAKIGEGATFRDPVGACTWHKARARRIPAGLYYFARNTVNPNTAADRFAALSAGMHSSLPGALDYETNDAGLSGQQACNWIRAFGARYRARTGLRLSVVYDAPGLWPGCASIPHAVSWAAALNGCRSVLSGFPDSARRMCQWTFHGPYGGDGDVFLRGSPAQLAAAAHAPKPKPKPKPVSARGQRVCSFMLRYRHATPHPTRWQRGNYRTAVKFMRRNHLSCELRHHPHARRV